MEESKCEGCHECVVALPADQENGSKQPDPEAAECTAEFETWWGGDLNTADKQLARIVWRVAWHARAQKGSHEDVGYCAVNRQWVWNKGCSASADVDWVARKTGKTVEALRAMAAEVERGAVYYETDDGELAEA